jgi:single-strand DNA-binding protein
MLNKVMLIGYIGKDIEVKETNNKIRVCNISVATNKKVKNEEENKWEDKTEWHNVVIFNKSCDYLHEYGEKGCKIYIEGELQTTKYQDKETGKDRYSTKIIANRVNLLSFKDKETNNESSKNTYTKANDINNEDIPF